MKPLSSSSTPTLGRILAIWLGSFLSIAIVLVTCFRTPLGPILLAGGLTLAVTLVRFFLKHQNH